MHEYVKLILVKENSFYRELPVEGRSLYEAVLFVKKAYRIWTIETNLSTYSSFDSEQKYSWEDNDLLRYR
jgi:hypothetical protein